MSRTVTSNALAFGTLAALIALGIWYWVETPAGKGAIEQLLNKKGGGPS